MPLKAKQPDPTNKRLKLFLFGGPGTGKTTAAISFPNSYIIDCERGTDHYDKQIKSSNSVVLQSTDSDEVIDEITALGTEQHAYRTVVIDPITTLEADLLAKAEKEYGSGDNRVWSKRDRTLRRLMNKLVNLDMNVIIIAHGKIEFGEKFAKLGTTHDGWRRLPYVCDLSLELEKRGQRRVGIVKKTRIEGFPDGAEFDFSYAEVAKRYGLEAIERQTVPVAVAPAEKIARMNELIKMLNVEQKTIESWLTKAGVDDLEDLPDAIADKAIDAMLKKVEKLKAA